MNLPDATSHRDVYFEMSFCPSLELVSVVRRFIAACYERVLTGDELAARVALAAHEMLENAVKYSVDGETYIRMDVLDGEVVIRTRNRADPGNVGIVRERLAAIQRSGDPDSHYHALIRDSAREPDRRGGLGLGRIASEAGMELSVVVDASGLVELTARSRRDHGDASVAAQ